jgi:hypothetical protein
MDKPAYLFPSPDRNPDKNIRTSTVFCAEKELHGVLLSGKLFTIKNAIDFNRLLILYRYMSR